MASKREAAILELPAPSSSRTALDKLHATSPACDKLIIRVTRADAGNSSALLAHADTIQTNPHLRCLRLEGPALTPVLVYLVCEIAAAMPLLEELEIFTDADGKSGNGLATTHASIADCIRAHPSLRTVKLDGLRFGDAGAAAIALAAAAMPCLESLGLTDCVIGDAGAHALSAALAGHPTLVNIILFENRISSEGVACLTAGLTSCPHLEKMWLPVMPWDLPLLAWFKRSREIVTLEPPLSSGASS